MATGIDSALKRAVPRISGGLLGLLLLTVSPNAFSAPPEHAPGQAKKLAREGELIIKFRADVPDAEIENVLRDGALKVKRHLTTGPMAKKGKNGITLAETEFAVPDAIARLKRHRAVEYIEPNYIYTHQATSNDPYVAPGYGYMWGLYGDLSSPANEFGSQAAEAWSAGYTGSEEVYVAVIDEGIDVSHPELKGNIWVNPFDPPDGVDNDGNGYIDDVNGWNFYGDNNAVFDPAGDQHGTHVAGTIGAKGGNGIGIAGVNWNVTILAGKFLGASGGSTMDAVEAIDYFVDMKRRHGLNLVAINASWGGGGYSQALHDAVIRAAKAGILFVAAAGNEALNNDSLGSYPANYDTRRGTSTESAASFDAVVSVAAIDSRGALASFSNYGASTVDLGAPGVDILSALPGAYLGYMNGTSMAAPHVTGAAALYASTHPGASVQEMRSALLGSVLPTSSLANKTVTGGRLNLSSMITAPPPAPAGLTAAGAPGSVRLEWTAAPGADHYVVRRGTTRGSPYSEIASGISALTYTDTAVNAGTAYFYVVAAVNSGGTSGHSGEASATPAAAAVIPAAPSSLIATFSGVSVVNLQWSDQSNNETGFRVYRRTGTGILLPLAAVNSNTVSFADNSISSGNSYGYAVAAFNSAGESARTAQVAVSIPSGSAAAFIRADAATGGSWKGSYGRDGYAIIRDSAAYPAYAQMSPSGNSDWVWNWNTTAPAALERAKSTGRLAACWYSFSPFQLGVTFEDSAVHRLSLYFLDWDNAGREQRIEILDPSTGKLLSSRSLSQFNRGVYLTWDVKGPVRIRIVPVKGNAVLSGIFLDPVQPAASAPIFTPAGGTYTNSASFSLSSGTSGATIHYTLDGTTPSNASPIFTGPVTLTNSAMVKARAMAPGMMDSPVASAAFTVVQPSSSSGATAVFEGANTTLGGTWKGMLGKEGHLTVADTQSLPAYAAFTAAGKMDWIWKYSTTDARAVQRLNAASRVAACFYSSKYMDLQLTFKDQQPHKVSLYFLDWDKANRIQKVEVMDRATGAILDSRELRNFQNGTYLSYTITGNATIRLTNAGPANAVISGIFFDPAS